MRIYFISKVPAALKVNGMYLGTIENFEKFINIEDDKPLIEVIPEDFSLKATSFVFNKNGENLPDKNIQIFFFEDEAMFNFYQFNKKDISQSETKQIRIDNKLVTFYSTGNQLKLNIESGKEFYMCDIDEKFLNAEIEEQRISNTPIIFIHKKVGQNNFINIFTLKGEEIFNNNVFEYKLSGDFETTIHIKDVAQHCLKTEWQLKNNKLVEKRNELSKKVDRIDKRLLPIVFIQELLLNGNIKPYLCEKMQKSGDKLKKYLGDYVDAIMPFSTFYIKHGEIKNVVGLVYPRHKNIYDINFFECIIENDLITNIRPI